MESIADSFIVQVSQPVLWLGYTSNITFSSTRETRHIATAYMLFDGYNRQCHLRYNITIKLAAILEQL